MGFVKCEVLINMTVERRLKARIQKRQSHIKQNKNQIDKVIVRLEQNICTAKRNQQKAAGQHHNNLCPENFVGIAFGHPKGLLNRQAGIIHRNSGKDQEQPRGINRQQQRNEHAYRHQRILRHSQEAAYKRHNRNQQKGYLRC